MRRRSAALAAGGLSLILLTAGAAAFWVRTPYQGFDKEVILDIDRGTSTRAVSRLLEDQGVISSRFALQLVRLLRPTAKVQAGEYRFRQAASSWQVFDRMARGDVHFYEVTIPEGSNLFDIAGLVGELGFIRPSDFMAAARDPELARAAAPGAASLEGFLFPSTYRVTRRTTARMLCQQMTAEFRARWKKLAPGEASILETVTLASLVEKETSVDEERPLVASVFRNRLAKGMKLECDPTTVYAALLDGRWRGVIYRSDLENEHPYNTYRHEGLPPGPIANPGEKALRAALRPAASDYLFFVAKPGGGGHQFSAGLAAHERAVQQHRRGAGRGRR